MKRFLVVLALCLLVVGIVAAPALAAGPNGQSGNSNTGHLNLYQKNPADWSIVPGGASGKLQYRLSGPTFDFVFNGHSLVAGKGYSLIYYVDPGPGPWPVYPWPGVVILASGTANGGGQIHLAGSVNTGSIPYATDVNYPTGGKIWLVVSADIPGGLFTYWNPTDYLFEDALITYTKT